MASSKASSQLADRVSCGVCMELFDNESHVPKLMPCQHTFCHSCIAASINRNSSPATIKCPTCRCQHTVPGEGFTTNRVALDIADELQREPTQVTVSGLNCTQHASKDAILVCAQCLHGLCVTCVKTSAHTHRGHDLHELDEAVPILQKKLKKNAEAKRIILQKKISRLQESPYSYAEMKKAETDIESIRAKISSEVEGWASGQFSTVSKLQDTAQKREQELSSDLNSLEDQESHLSTLLHKLHLHKKIDDQSTRHAKGLEMAEFANCKFAESTQSLQTNVVSILTSSDSLQSTFLCQQVSGVKAYINTIVVCAVNLLGILMFITTMSLCKDSRIVPKYMRIVGQAEEKVNSLDRSFYLLVELATCLIVFQVVYGLIITSNEWINNFKRLANYSNNICLLKIHGVLIRIGDDLKFKLLLVTHSVLLFTLVCYMLVVHSEQRNQLVKAVDCADETNYVLSFWQCYSK